jgi:deazaflavin-dependent oxidoreductase (nitroreductase family)
MWFMNKIANPFVRFILRSPFHKMMSAVVMLITYRGRKSGKTYTLPVNYVQVGKTIYIVPGMPEQKTWWRNLRGGAEVTLALKGKSVSGSAMVLEGDAEGATEALRHYLTRFRPSAKLHHVRLEADGSFHADDLQKAARDLTVVKVECES